MRAVIFQIGLLLFFVSILTLWLRGMDIIIAVVKSFVLFVASTLVMFLMAYLFIYLKQGENRVDSSEGGQLKDSKV